MPEIGAKEFRWRTAASWAAVAVWMALIFFMSGRPMELSGADSGRIAQMIVSLLEAAGARGRLNSEDVTLVLFVRKAGHFLEYSILTFLLMNAMLSAKTAGRGKRDYKKVAAAAFLVALAYAVSDEVHQSFVPGRSMRAGDVAIDAASSFSAILIYMRHVVKKKLF